MRPLVLAVSFSILTIATSVLGTSAYVGEGKAAAAQTMSATDLRNAMRKLWTDHTTYTRSYIVSAVAGLPDLPTSSAACSWAI